MSEAINQAIANIPGAHPMQAFNRGQYNAQQAKLAGLQYKQAEREVLGQEALADALADTTGELMRKYEVDFPLHHEKWQNAVEDRAYLENERLVKAMVEAGTHAANYHDSRIKAGDTPEQASLATDPLYQEALENIRVLFPDQDIPVEPFDLEELRFESEVYWHWPGKIEDLIGALQYRKETKVKAENEPDNPVHQTALKAIDTQLLSERDFKRTGGTVSGVKGIEDNTFVTALEDETSGELFLDTAHGRISLTGTQFQKGTRTGAPGDFGKTSAQSGSDVQIFEDAAIAALDTFDTATDTFQLVAEDQFAIGKPGTLARVGNEISRTFIGVSKFLRPDMTPEDVNELLNASYDYSSFRGTAIQSEEVRSSMTALAFSAAAAAGQTGRALSDRDIQLFLNQIGSSTSDPIAFKNVLHTFISRTVRNIRNRAKVKGFTNSATLKLVEERWEGFEENFNGQGTGSRAMTIQELEQRARENP